MSQQSCRHWVEQLLVLAMLTTPTGCGSKTAQTAAMSNELGGNGAPDAAQAASCGATLASRLSVTTLDVDDDIRYKRDGYDNIPTDARIAFAIAPSGNGYVAWSDNSLNNVHITPLTALQTRLGPDIVIPAHDIGGLVAHDDGFALLVSRDDPGQALLNPNFSTASNPVYGYAAVLLRYTNGTETFAAALTGTASITSNASDPQYDCVENMDGRLASNGSYYGAYFTVHQCELPNGSANSGGYADKLVYVDVQGQPLSGGWNWGCQIDEDLRLLPEANQFTALCMKDTGANAGMNLVREGASVTLDTLAQEFATVGFCSGQFGSVTNNASNNGYTVSWLSRGGVAGQGDNQRPAKSANDIALLNLSSAPDYNPDTITYVTNTPDINEMNLHLAPYGTDRLLVAWDNVENIDCNRVPNTQTCFGDYTGTHFRLMDAKAEFLTADEVLPAPPNSRDDMVVFPNGDVGWAFVPDSNRNYSGTLPLDSHQVPDVPARRQLSIARLIQCAN